MAEEDLKEMIKDVMRELFEEHANASTTTKDEHAIHHDWVRIQLARMESRRAMWAAVRNKALPMAIVTILGYTGTQLLNWWSTTSIKVEHLPK